MNHFLYAWCDDMNQFVNFLNRIATIIQRPWIKQGVCMAVEGPEGHGKSFFCDQVIGKIIGYNHYASIQDIQVSNLAKVVCN